VLSALHLRNKTGKGSRVDVSMLESLVEWMGFPLYYSYDGANPPPRAGASHATIYPYGPFPTAPGQTVMLGLQNEREWASFCEKVLQKPELLQDERFDTNAKRSANREALRAIIIEKFAELGTKEVVARLDAAPIANAQVNNMHQVWEHPQLRARERWVEVDSPRGKLPALLPPGANRAYQPRMDAIPSIGQHNESILKELGYSESQIAELKEVGAL